MNMPLEEALLTVPPTEQEEQPAQPDEWYPDFRLAEEEEFEDDDLLDDEEDDDLDDDEDDDFLDDDEDDDFLDDDDEDDLFEDDEEEDEDEEL